MSNKVYIVAPASDSMLRIIDHATGAQVGQIHTGGKITGSPMVAGNSCSVPVQMGSSQQVRTYSLPSGAMTSSSML